MLGEIEQCKKDFGLRYFQLVDDVFLMNKQHAYDVVEAFRKADVSWGFQTRVGLIHMLGEEIIARCAEAGAKEISVGVEAADEQLRFLNGKGFTDQQLKEVVEWCRGHRIEVNFFLIAGLIGETEETLEKLQEFSTHVVEPSYIQVNLAVPFPGTELFDLAVKQRVVTSDVWDRWIRGEIGEEPRYIPLGLTKQQMQEAQRQAYKRFYFRLSYVARRLRRDLADWRALARDCQIASTLFDEFVWADHLGLRGSQQPRTEETSS